LISSILEWGKVRLHFQNRNLSMVGESFECDKVVTLKLKAA